MYICKSIYYLSRLKRLYVYFYKIYIYAENEKHIKMHVTVVLKRKMKDNHLEYLNWVSDYDPSTIAVKIVGEKE